MHEEWEIRSLPREENLEKALRNLWGSRFEWDERVWERKQRAIERDIEWNEVWIAQGGLYRTLSKSRQMRCREVSRGVEVGVEKMLVDNWGIEQVLRNNSSDPRTEARSIHQVSRSYRGGRSFIDRSTRYQGAVGIAIWKSLRSSTDSKVSSHFLKPVFREEKNTNMNAIQHTTQPIIQSTQ